MKKHRKHIINGTPLYLLLFGFQVNHYRSQHRFWLNSRFPGLKKFVSSKPRTLNLWKITAWLFLVNRLIELQKYEYGALRMGLGCESYYMSHVTGWLRLYWKYLDTSHTGYCHTLSHPERTEEDFYHGSKILFRNIFFILRQVVEFYNLRGLKN